MKRGLLVMVAVALAQGAFAESILLRPPEGISYRSVLLVQMGVKDLDLAVRFYTEMLGFVLTERRDDLQFAHLATNVEGLEIGLSQQQEPLGSGSVLLNIGVADVQAARRAIESRGVTFTRPTIVIPGKVALAEFADPDGNRLRFAGPPPTAEKQEQ